MSSSFSPSVPEAVARVQARNPRLHAFVRTRLEEALFEHRQRLETSSLSELHGVPYSLKDLWDTRGMATTGGSYRYRDRTPEESSPVHGVFEDAGAVLIGKTNASDLGMSLESQSWVGGITSNPLDPSRTAGGSSGGAAAAVADGMSAFDWGSDFGGSIRLPSAFCGIHGLRLSSETWPIRGHFPGTPPALTSMLGQGPMTRDLETMRAVLRVAAPRLRTGNERKFQLRGAYVYTADGRTAADWQTFAADVAPALAGALGTVRHDHGLLRIQRAFLLAHGLYCSHLDEFLGVDPSLTFQSGLQAVLSGAVLRGRWGDRRFHPRTAEVLLLIGFGRYTLHRDKQRALQRAQRYRDEVSALWDRGFIVVLPTATRPAPKHGTAFRKFDLAAFAMPGNVVDATALAVPFGRFANGLPRSLQLWGPPGSEQVLIDLAETLNKAPAKASPQRASTHEKKIPAYV